MAAMKKADVLERLRNIQRLNNESNKVVLELLKEVKAFDDVLTAEDSSTIRHKLYHHADNGFCFKEAINRLEGAMYHAEERCYQCGESHSTDANPIIKDENGSHIHKLCLEKLEANREASKQHVADYFAGKKESL